MSKIIKKINLLKLKKKLDKNINCFFEIHPEAKPIEKMKFKNVLDIGGHYGEYSYYLSKVSNKVHYFEPNPNSFDIFKKTLFNNKIIPYNFACGEKQKIVYITDKKDSAQNKISNNGIEIKQIKIDDIIKEKIDFIKIDIEGYEYNCLLGMKEILKNKPLLLIEIKKPNFQKVKKLLYSCGYKDYLKTSGEDYLFR